MNRAPRGAKSNTIYDVLARVPLFKDARWEDIEFEPLDSFTNLNYKVIACDKAYVLRIAGEGTSTYIDRAAEEYNARIATAAGLNAETLFFDINDGTMLSCFVEGSSMDKVRFYDDPTATTRAALVLKRIHSFDQAFRSRFDAFEMIDYYLKLLRKLQVSLPEGCEEIKQEADAVRQALGTVSAPLTPCHNDTWPENFVEVGERIYLIDWEYSGMNDPMWDLGNLSVEARFSAEQDQVMMEAYCGGFVWPGLYDRMVLYKAISDYLWGVWSIVQYANNNPAADFWTYTLNRFEHCKVLMGSAEFSHHLSAVRRGY
ncbi:MAG: phosphotransferase family protein [Rubrobacter sp.]|nr:phosphotransferase family protein [Rubrobacter sp.]